MTKQKFKIGLIAFVLGAGLMWIGYTSGGLTDLVNHQAKTENIHKEVKEYTGVKALDIQLANKSITIGESADDKVHLTYYHGDGKNESRMETSLENGNLKIVEKYDNPIIVLSALNSMVKTFRDLSDDRTRVVLELPKGQKLDSLKADLDNGSFEAKNIDSKNSHFDLDNGSLTAENLTSDKATFAMDNGAIKLRNPQIQSVSLSNDNGEVRLENGSIANGRFILDNGAFRAKQVTWSGENSIENSNGEVELTIPEKNLQELSFDLHTDLGSIEVPSEGFQKNSREDSSTSTKTVENPQGRITVRNSLGRIKVSGQ